MRGVVHNVISDKRLTKHTLKLIEIVKLQKRLIAIHDNMDIGDSYMRKVERLSEMLCDVINRLVPLVNPNRNEINLIMVIRKLNKTITKNIHRINYYYNKGKEHGNNTK